MGSRGTSLLPIVFPLPIGVKDVGGSLSRKEAVWRCFYSHPVLKLILQRQQDAPLCLTPSSKESFSSLLEWHPETGTPVGHLGGTGREEMAGICHVLVGNRVKPPSGGSEPPPSWPGCPGPPSSPRGEPTLHWSMSPAAPYAAAAVSLRASPSLFLCSPPSLSQPLLWLRAAWGDAAAGPVSWCLVGAIIPHPSPALPKLVTPPSPSPSPPRGQGAGQELTIMPRAASRPGGKDRGGSERRESSADR